MKTEAIKAADAKAIKYAKDQQAMNRDMCAHDFRNGFLTGIESTFARDYWRDLHDKEMEGFERWKNEKYRLHPVIKKWYFYDPADIDIPDYYSFADLLKQYRSITNKTDKG